MVKLTVVSGFLGAGKTTLLRQLIVRSVSQTEHCVVVENEFGAIGFDAALLARTGVQVHELNQGCICCTLQTNFSDTLKNILTAPLPDRVFFEPSGIFIPDRFLATLRSPEFAQRCQIASFITVVDAQNFISCQKKYGSFFHRQAEFADILAIGKFEDLDTQALKNVQAALLQINPRVRQLWVSREDVSSTTLDEMLDGNMRTTNSISRGLPLALDTQARTEHFIRFRPARPEEHNLEVVSGQLPESMGIGDLEKLLIKLASGRFGNILRVKGTLWHDTCSIDFSLVAGSVEIMKSRPIDREEQPDSEHSGGMIVVIGETLDKHGLREVARLRPDEKGSRTRER